MSTIQLLGNVAKIWFVIVPMSLFAGVLFLGDILTEDEFHEVVFGLFDCVEL